MLYTTALFTINDNHTLADNLFSTLLIIVLMPLISPPIVTMAYKITTLKADFEAFKTILDERTFSIPEYVQLAEYIYQAETKLDEYLVSPLTSHSLLLYHPHPLTNITLGNKQPKTALSTRI